MKGITVMINELFGVPSEEPIKHIGKKITGIVLDENILSISFQDGSLKLWDDGQNCCESRYMTTDDDLLFFVGADFAGIELRGVPNVEAGNDYDEHEIQFLLVNTSLGTFTMENHNIHNGYYGGFSVTVEFVPA